jgi:hypothetical protein
VAAEPPVFNAAWQREALAELVHRPREPVDPYDKDLVRRDWRVVGGDQKGFGAGEGSQMLFVVLWLCVYTHQQLPVLLAIARELFRL